MSITLGNQLFMDIMFPKPTSHWLSGESYRVQMKEGIYIGRESEVATSKFYQTFWHSLRKITFSCIWLAMYEIFMDKIFVDA